jgi:hypothetical protein
MNPRLKTVGLQMGRAMLVGTASGLRVWLHDKQPSQGIHPFRADVLGSVFIRMCFVPALFTDEKLSSLSVRRFGVVALVALLAGMLRIGKDTEHAASLGFVGNEASKLVKAPGVHAVALIFLSPYPVTDAVEIFESNPTPGAFSQRYYGFGNGMIHVRRKPLLFAATATQKPFGALGAFLLQLLTQRMMPVAHLVQMGAAVVVAVRIESDIGDTEIDADKVDWQRSLGFRGFDSDVQIETVVPINQIALAARQGKKLALIIAADERNRESSTSRPDRDGRLVEIPRKQTQIVDGRASGSECARTLADCVGVRDLCTSTNSSLSRQTEEQANSFVARSLQFERRINIKLSGPLRKPIARRIESLRRCKKDLGLLWRRLQLNLGDQLHAYSSIRNSAIKLNPRPTTKAVGFFPFQ